jgi:hypothetical protein
MDPAPLVFQTNKYLKGGVGGNVPDDFIGDPTTDDSTGTILITVNLASANYIVSYRDKSSTVPIKGAAATVSQIVISSLLPNPVGEDRQLEEVTLLNKGTTPIPMENWYLQDKEGRVWSLVSLGTIEPNQSATIQRNGMPMNLNNNWDDVYLYDPNYVLVDKFSYASTQEGVVINTNH